MRINPFNDKFFMKEALKEARKALAKDEVPVGCIIVCDNQIIARGHNLTETLNDVTAHAEMQAITSAADFLGGKYLNECTLYVTLEPCVMCAGAILQARIEQVVFAAREPISGAAGSVVNLLESDWMNHRCKVTAGICSEESVGMLKAFFSGLRPA